MLQVDKLTTIQLCNMLSCKLLFFLWQHLLEPLCRAVETDLRLSIHTHLKLDERNPFKVPMQDVSHFLKMKPIRFFSYFIDIKGKFIHIKIN